MERAKGIEPSYAAWEAAVLPLNYARSVNSPCISAHDADGSRRFGTRISAKLNSRLRGRDLLPGTRYRQADSPAKMLGQLQALGLVIRTDAAAIEGVGPRQHMFVDQAADDLIVLDNERHLVGPHLQHRAGASPPGARVTEARIKEAGVVDAEFADQRIERNNFGGVIGRHLDGFLGRQDVELVGIKNEAAVVPCPDGLPEFPRRNLSCDRRDPSRTSTGKVRGLISA